MKLELTDTAVKKAHEEGCNDVKKALENLFPKVFEDIQTYCRGDKFKHNGSTYILARADKLNGKELGFICLASGNMWGESVVVKDTISITQAEFEKLTQTGTFTKIPYGEKC